MKAECPANSLSFLTDLAARSIRKRDGSKIELTHPSKTGLGGAAGVERGRRPDTTSLVNLVSCSWIISAIARQ